MQWLAPAYYPRFSCIAAKCRHNCCIGWEIDIDEETLAFYRTVDGTLGKRLRHSIKEDDPPHFILKSDGRCSFLNRDNLCDLMLQLGENSLCQICADHPRFRNDWSDRTEIGLGLCCEAAGRLILNTAAPVSLIPLWEDEAPPTPPTQEEQRLRALRDEVISILQDRRFSISERLRSMLRHCHAVIPEHTVSDWADIFLSLERLDEAWTSRLMAFKAYAGPMSAPAPIPDVMWEQLSVYFVYRHFPAALEDGDAAGKAAFAALSVQILQALSTLEYAKAGTFPPDDLVELCRMYSSEIEYSSENLTALFSLLP